MRGGYRPAMPTKPANITRLKPKAPRGPSQLPHSADSVIATARRVLNQEAHALGALAEILDSVFGEVVELFFGLKGRVVVTGMGKSGHIARKIAATFASTGTPAMFVHPGEASHGDLGMITPDDTVLALSNSGEAPELGAILNYTKRFGITLVGLTGGTDNTLANAADLVLVLPAEPEGKVLLKVSDVMHRADALPLVTLDRPMAEAIIIMTERGFGCAGAIDGEGRLVGIVTDGDLRRHMGPGLMDSPVAAVMTSGPKTIAPDALAAEALGVMNMSDRPFTAMFVVADGRPIGIVSVHDLLRAGVM